MVVMAFNSLRLEDLVRIGTMFDCEGSAGIYWVHGGRKCKDGSPTTRFPRPVVQIGMISGGFIAKELHEKLGFGSISTYKLKSGKTFYLWQAYCRDALTFATLMRDYSIVKIDKLKAIMRFYENIDGRPYDI